MSDEGGRIAVPSNGRGPHPDPDPLPPPPVVERPGSGGLASPFSPMQLAVGFGIVASIIAILVRRARRGRRDRPLDRG